MTKIKIGVELTQEEWFNRWLDRVQKYTEAFKGEDVTWESAVTSAHEKLQEEISGEDYVKFSIWLNEDKI